MALLGTVFGEGMWATEQTFLTQKSKIQSPELRSFLSTCMTSHSTRFHTQPCTGSAHRYTSAPGTSPSITGSAHRYTSTPGTSPSISVADLLIESFDFLVFSLLSCVYTLDLNLLLDCN